MSMVEIKVHYGPHNELALLTIRCEGISRRSLIFERFVRFILFINYKISLNIRYFEISIFRLFKFGNFKDIDISVQYI